MDEGLGQTVQSRDDSFYLFGRSPGTAPGEPFDMGQLLPDEEPLPAGEYLGQDGEGGVRVLEGSIASDGDEPSTAEYQSALQATYTANSVEPKRGDFISLKVSGGTRLVARFWILDDDNAATNATVAFTFGVGDPPVSTTFYGLNVSYSPIEQIIDAIQDYIAGANGGQDPDGRDVEPSPAGPFAISVNGNYSTDEDGFLVPSNSATIGVLGGTFKANADVTAIASGISSSKSFPGSDGITLYHVYLLVTATMSDGTLSSVAAEISIRETSDENPPSQSEWTGTGSTLTKGYTIGTVAFARRGNRRYARITQSMIGTITNTTGTSGGTASDTNGADTRPGPREIILCVNGKPYKTHIITTELVEVT